MDINITTRSLVNFYARDDVKYRFDTLVALSSRTRTDVLNELMEDYVLRQTAFLQERRSHLVEVDKLLSSLGADARHHSSVRSSGNHFEHEDAIGIEFDDGTDYWQDRL